MFCCVEAAAKAEAKAEVKAEAKAVAGVSMRGPLRTSGRLFYIWRGHLFRIRQWCPLLRHRRLAGFTMLEVLVALCLFSFALLPLLDGFARTSGTIGEITLRQEAAILAAANLEILASKPFADLTPGRGQLVETPQHVRGRIRQVLDVDDVWPGRLRRLTITVETIETVGVGKQLLVLGTLRRNEHPGRGGE